MQTGYQIGEWIVRPHRDSIESGQRTVHVKPKAMAVLCCLARARGEVVTRNEIFDTVWPGSSVSDAVLTQCVLELRQAFGETARDAKIIETIPRVGLRLSQPVIPLDGDPASQQAEAPGSPETARRRSVRWRAGLLFAAVLVVATLAWQLADRHEPSADPVAPLEKTLAVLPFVDMTDARDRGYLADGLTEELINRLARLDGLRVAARTSSFRFKDRNEDVRDIADALNVGYLLEGSVRKQDKSLRITAQLIEVGNGLHLWSKTYDRPLEDIFAIQEEISEAVATALSISLAVGELGQHPLGTTRFEAYEEFLRAQSLQSDFTRDSLLLAIDHARSAVEIDPGFAAGWYLLSDLYREVGTFKGVTMGGEWLPLSLDALDHAIELDPDPDGGSFQKTSLLLLELKWGEAQEVFGPLSGREQVEDDLRNFHYAFFLHHVGRVREAIPLMEHWLRLHPGSQGAAGGLANMYAAQGRFEEAFAMAERAYDTGDYIDLSALGGLKVALSAGDRDQLSKWVPLRMKHAEDAEVIAFLQAMNQTLDDPPAATAILRSVDPDLFPYEVALWAAWHGDTELALQAMRRSKTSFAFWLPVMADIRRLPSFQDLVRDMGLVDYWREYGWNDFCRPLGEEAFECE